MSNSGYPEGIDCVWLASDQDGHIGAFMTGGIGPIPKRGLCSDIMPLEDIEGLICDMPIVSEVRLLISVKRPDDIIDLAKRGVFVYDWTDLHRTAREAIDAYEKIAIPTRPIKSGMLSTQLNPIARVLRFSNVKFVDKITLDVRAHLNCCESQESC